MENFSSFLHDCLSWLLTLSLSLSLSLSLHLLISLPLILSPSSSWVAASLSLSLSLSLSRVLLFSLYQNSSLFLFVYFKLQYLSLLLETQPKTMAFAGTTQKCKACEKTVYLVDQLTADNKVYHKACFRCHHCKGTLELSNYSSFEGVLYCKPHFDQLFKRTGSLDKSFESVPRVNKVDKSVDHEGHTNSKVSGLFAGTQDKCVACGKTVYPIEKVAVDGASYHRPCFKCSHGGCTISPSNYVAHEGRLYCKHHQSQLFKEKGNFSQFGKHEHDKGVTENTEVSN